jgi:hypothetical protein
LQDCVLSHAETETGSYDDDDDPSGSLDVPQLRETLLPLVTDFKSLVLKDVAPPGLD